ncbi:MAG: hypothetical protein H6696_19230 [Deferribacteres bacterium]|nr:hypothetical protein [candidate division KSB1 bacterium]MCB9504063.1 hypothetical protein [Deferribacteres bacterium]
MIQSAAPQVEIETRMRDIVKFGSYEAVYLFSEEGLYLAKAHSDDPLDEERLAEISLILNDVKRLANTLGKIQRLKEVFMEGDNFRKIIFRFFTAFGQNVVLAAVVAPHKTYRRYTNDLQRMINSFEFNEE